MKCKNLLFSIALVFFVFGSVFAQQSTVNSGSNATGSNGNVSYSVGQIAYTTNTGTTGSMAQGVQQPYEIQTVLGVDNFNINLQMTVYPNPTVNLLSLEVKDYDTTAMFYQLFDLNGRLILDNKIATNEITISLEQYPSAVYLLKVLSNNKEVKTFKIIKK